MSRVRRNRVAAGVPTGGRFTAMLRREGGLRLGRQEEDPDVVRYRALALEASGPGLTPERAREIHAEGHDRHPNRPSLEALEEYESVRQALVRNPSTPSDVLHWSIAHYDPQYGEGLGGGNDPESLLRPVMNHPKVGSETLDLIASQAAHKADRHRARVLRMEMFGKEGPAGKMLMLGKWVRRALI